MSEPQSQDEKMSTGDAVAGATKVDKKVDYEVGWGRPPEKYKWTKGQSGNPGGRPRKKLDPNALLEKLLNERIPIRVDGEPRKVPANEAILRSMIARAIKGDTRAAKLVMPELACGGFGAEQDRNVTAQPFPKDSSLQSDALFGNLKIDLLSNSEKIELARIGEIIDLGGDFTALSERDFELAKQIANKGRGKDVSSSQ